MSGDMSGLVKRLEAVTSRLEQLAAKGGKSGGGGGDENTEIVEEFDRCVMGGKLTKYLSLSAKIGSDVAEHSKLVKGCFDQERALLVLASKHRVPKPNVLKELLKPLTTAVNKVTEYSDKHRGSKQFNFLACVKEGIGCVGWVTVAPKTAPYVKECGDQSQFYGNRVIKEFKGKNEDCVEWVRAYSGAIKDLEEYVKTYHTTGLSWNPAGTELSSAPAAPPAGAAPGPPPPPPPIVPPTDAPAPSGGSAESARANLFASLNKGADITAGLKKVTNDMKTHKNPELRASSVVKASAKPSAAPSKPTTTAPAKKKSPVCELQGQKWIVEYQEDAQLDITPTDPKQQVYMYSCNKCTLRINGKFNAITVDKCKRVGVVVDDVISCVESINSQSVQIQIMGACPTVSIDKTDGCQVYLSLKSLKAEIVTAKSSEMNILIPDKEGEFSEFAVPEQFKTIWDGKKLVTNCTDIAS